MISTRTLRYVNTRVRTCFDLKLRTAENIDADLYINPIGTPYSGKRRMAGSEATQLKGIMLGPGRPLV